MERKIGEIFEYNNEWYQCVERPKDYIDTVCKTCDFSGRGNCELDRCSGTYRSDKKSVIFKKLKKIGEPHFIKDEIFEGSKVYVQNFKVYEDFEGHKPICNDYIIYDWKNRIISIEIKQTKEDMEEKKLNLKPFDLEAAKLGKPVCTRGGRKARIICFDANIMPENKNILALIRKDDGSEYVEYYTSNGKFSDSKDDINDLMMFPEKKEGWVNLYPCDYMGQKRYSTKEEALKKALSDVIATVKIEWEE